MIESVGIEGGADLLGILLADGGQLVTADDGTLGQIDIAVVFQNITVCLGKVEDVAEDREVINALILYIMNGIDRMNILTRVCSMQ